VYSGMNPTVQATRSGMVVNTMESMGDFGINEWIQELLYLITKATLCLPLTEDFCFLLQINFIVGGYLSSLRLL
jgi:hypothetical protein